MDQTRVEHVMSRKVELVAGSSDVHEAEKLFLGKRVHGAPVIDESQRLVGVLTQTDLLAWHFETGVDGAPYFEHDRATLTESELRSLPVSDIRSAKVEELMSPQVFCIGPDRPIAEAAAMMIQKWIHRLIVVDETLHVLGVVSAIDLLHSIPGVREALAQARTEKA